MSRIPGILSGRSAVAGRNIPLLVVILYFVLAYKVVRMAPLPMITSFWNLHLYLLLIFGGTVILHLGRFFHNATDRLVIIFGLGLLVTAVVNGVLRDPRFIVVYMLPLVAYYFPRGFWFHPHEFETLLKWLSGLLIGTYLVEFIGNNFLGLPVIDYETFRAYTESEGIRAEEFSDFKVHPLFGQKILRIPGVTLAPQPTAVLYASLAVYHLVKWRNDRSKRVQLFLGTAALLVVLLANSGTGFLVLVALLLLSAGNQYVRVLGIFALPLAAAGVLIFHYGDRGLEVGRYLLQNLIDAYFRPLLDGDPGVLAAFMLGGGTGEAAINWEINFIDILYAIGLVNVVILVLLLASYVHTGRRLLRMGLDVRPQMLFVGGIILGSVHYDSLFRYPSSLVVFAMIGYASKALIVMEGRRKSLSWQDSTAERTAIGRGEP